MTEKAYEVGLASEERYHRFAATKNAVEAERQRLENTFVLPSEISEFLKKHDSSPLQNRSSLAELLKRPEMSYVIIAEIDSNRTKLTRHAITQLEVQIKYEGYVAKQLQQIEKFKKLENRRLSAEFDYAQVDGLRIEARQKLNQIKPISVGQASRISGVSPADINVLLIHLEKLRRR